MVSSVKVLHWNKMSRSDCVVRVFLSLSVSLSSVFGLILALLF